MSTFGKVVWGMITAMFAAGLGTVIYRGIVTNNWLPIEVASVCAAGWLYILAARFVR